MSFEDNLVKNITKCVNNPLRYVLYAFDWNNGSLKGFDGPDEWQREFLLSIGERLQAGEHLENSIRYAIASGHGIGKSTMVAWLILWAMSTMPHINGVVSANTFNQLSNKTWKELAKWHMRAINAHWFSWHKRKFEHAKYGKTWFFEALAWSEHNTEAFAGLHADYVMVIFDEASAISDAIWEVSEGAMTTVPSYWFVFGNPTRNSGYFRECFRKFRHVWHSKQIDSRQAKITNKQQIEQWERDYGKESDFFKVRVMGIFPAQDNQQFIGNDLLNKAFVHYDKETFETNKPAIIGVDVARFGSDASVIVIRRANILENILHYRSISTTELVGYILEQIQLHKPIAVSIDGGGVGGGVIDQLKSFGIANIIEVNFGAKADDKKKYFNKRAEMWSRMRDWLKEAIIDSRYQELYADLSAIRYKVNEKGQIVLEKKADMKKRGVASPDFADALALTFSSKFVNKAMNMEQHHAYAFEQKTDYNPYE